MKAYQKDHKISTTGTADERTLESIYGDVLSTEQPAAEPVSTPQPAPAPSAAPQP